MENPADWGPAECVVAEVIQEHNSLAAGIGGYSLPMKITLALREAGLLKEE